jgi:hypothetical protein
MSDVVSMVDSLKFENKITKITKTYVGRPKSEDISFCVKSSFFRELSKAKANYSEFSYTDIVNTQLSSVRLKFSERLENRFEDKTNYVMRKLKKLTRRKPLNYENELNKIAIFSNELENVYNLNFKICNFSQENLELEKKCSDLHKCLLEEINTNSKLCKQIEHMKIVQNDNAGLIECLKSLEKKIVNPNPGKQFPEVSDINKGRKLSEFKLKAETALWFAETYGLEPQSLKLSNNSFESIEIDFSDTVKQYNYQDLANEEKKKLKDLIFNLDRFGISDNAYNELSIFEKRFATKDIN